MKEEIEDKFKELLKNFKEEVKELGIKYGYHLIKESGLNVGDTVTLDYGLKIKIESFKVCYDTSNPTKTYVRVQGEMLKKDGKPRKKKEGFSTLLERVVK